MGYTPETHLTVSKDSVRAASTGNVSVTSPGTTLDGVTLAASNRILLKNQTTASQNGIYVWSGAATALVRAADANSAAELTTGTTTFVEAGTVNSGKTFTLTTAGQITPGTTSLTFESLNPTQVEVDSKVSKSGDQMTGVLDFAAATGARITANQAAVEGFIRNDLVDGDANPAFQIIGSGEHRWGAGGATAPDTTLYRATANVLKTDDYFLSSRAATTDFALGATVAGDAQERFTVNASGKIEWGPGGAAARDTNLYRSAVSTLASDDTLHLYAPASTERSLRVGTGVSAPSHAAVGKDTLDQGYIGFGNGTTLDWLMRRTAANVVNIDAGDYLRQNSAPLVGDDLSNKTYVDSVAGGSTPPGIISSFAGPAAPSGWLLCYGQFVTQSAFPTLFTAIGHTYNGGVDPGDGTFKIPDLRGRGVIGLDNIGGTDAGRLSVANTLGGSGGVESALLGLNEMPSHTHAGTTASDNIDHSHSGTTADINQNHTHSGSTGTVSTDHGHTVPGGSFKTANGSNISVPSGSFYTLTGMSSNSTAAGTNGISANHTHAFTTGTVSSGHTHGFTSGGRSAFHQHTFTTGAPVGYGAQTALSKLAPYLLLNWMISTGASYVAPVNVAEMIPRSVLGSKGNILVATATGVEGVIAPPATNQLLLGDTATATGWKLHTGPRPNQVEWTTPTLGSGWTQYAAPYGPTRYMKDAEGTVFMKGLLTRVGGGNIPFTLPVGMRPSQTLIFACLSGTTGTAIRVDIDSAGIVSLPNGGDHAWVTFTLNFKAEQ